MSPSGQHVLLGLRFQELSWDHTSPEEEEPVLWLEFDGDSEGTPVNKLLRIYSKQVVVWAHTRGLRGQFQVFSAREGGCSAVQGLGIGCLPAAGLRHPGDLCGTLGSHTRGDVP